MAVIHRLVSNVMMLHKSERKKIDGISCGTGSGSQCCVINRTVLDKCER